jgi:hypothetical protein
MNLAAQPALANVDRCRGEQLVDQGWSTILPGMPSAAFAA